MNVAICDDMPEIVLELSQYVEAYFNRHNYNLSLFKFNSGIELLKSTEKYDLMLLDVEIGEENGIEVGKVLKERNPYDHRFRCCSIRCCFCLRCSLR